MKVNKDSLSWGHFSFLQTKCGNYLVKLVNGTVVGGNQIPMLRQALQMGVDFEEGRNRSTQRKPSKSGWDRLKFSPQTTFIVVEVGGVIDIHYASLTSHYYNLIVCASQARLYLPPFTPPYGLPSLHLHPLHQNQLMQGSICLGSACCDLSCW